VIYEDNHIIVIDKPPLLATMGVRADQPSLVQWTKAWLKRKYDKPGNVYLGVVSRLDAFTTGLVMLARTSKAAGRLTKQFQAGEVQKTYTAILEQRPTDAAGRLVDWMVKDDLRRRMIVTQPETVGAKRGELEYQVSGYDGPLTLLRINLLTGRKHQIRVQFSSRGWPVLGDRKYSGKRPFGPGIALQSSALQFVHPVRQEPLSFRIEPPAGWDLARFGNK
jgi:23S rRNA pseudouridine1911/1915/1917 synthase